MSMRKGFVISALFLIMLSFIGLAGICLSSAGGNSIMAMAATEEKTISASGACGENLTWELTDDGTLRIEGEGAMSSYSNGSAPWYEYRNSITIHTLHRFCS